MRVIELQIGNVGVNRRGRTNITNVRKLSLSLSEVSVMKKFLSAFMLAIFASVALQFSATKTARAEYLVYCFSRGELEFYIDLDSSAIMPPAMAAVFYVKGYSPAMNSVVTVLASMQMELFTDTDTYVLSYPNERTESGRISQSSEAMAVYRILEQHYREVKAQQRREAEAREREKQRLAEQKRHEEEALKNKFDSLIAAGDQAYTAKDYLAATRSYESARKFDSSSVDKFISELVKNGDDLTAQGNYPAALDYYKKAVVMNPADSSNRDKIWETYVSSNNFSDGANFYQRMTTIKPDDYYYFCLGYSLDELKDYDGAIAAYTRSLELNPHEFIYKYRGGAYKNSWRYDEAIADYKKALELNSDYKDALDELWDAYYKSGKFDEAIDFYKPRVASDIKGWDASKHLWEAYLITRNFDDAINFYRTRINNKRYFGDDLFKLAWLLNEQKKFPDAIKAMKKYIEFRNTADSWYWLAKVYQNAGDTKKAVDTCKKALKLDPKHANAKKLLAQLSGGK